MNSAQSTNTHLIGVVHAHTTAASREVVDLPLLASAAISRREDDLEFAGLVNDKVCRSVL